MLYLRHVLLSLQVYPRALGYPQDLFLGEFPSHIDHSRPGEPLHIVVPTSRVALVILA